MKKTMLWCILLGVCVIPMAGCVKSQNEQGQTTYALKPSVPANVDKGLDFATVIFAALATIFPWAVPIATALIGIKGTWMVVKPKITTAQTKLELATTAGQVTVIGIEAFKKACPDKWADLSKFLDEAKARLPLNEYAIIKAFIESLIV